MSFHVREAFYVSWQSAAIGLAPHIRLSFWPHNSCCLYCGRLAVRHLAPMCGRCVIAVYQHILVHCIYMYMYIYWRYMAAVLDNACAGT